MQKIFYVLSISIGVVASVFGLTFFSVIVLSSAGRGLVSLHDIETASYFGQFVGGYFGTIMSIAGALLLFANLLNQSMTNARVAFESHFYRMMDYHFHHVASLEVRHVRNVTEMVAGNRAFIVFKLHLERLLQGVQTIDTELELQLPDNSIADIASVAFYYGLEEENRPFLIEKLRMYPKSDEIVARLLLYKEERQQTAEENVGRPNQTNLGSYFRNMYHLIKYVDTRHFLTAREKRRYINVLRAQLSNSELWLLYFNLVSRFGRKWIQYDYVMRYQLIRNLPRGFCKPFDHTQTFPMAYEDDDLAPETGRAAYS